MKKTRLIIVDDCEMIRKVLKLLLLSIEEIEIAAEASDGQEALDLIAKNDYDVVLMDINMPNLNGIEATKQIKKIDKNIKILTNSFNVSAFYVKEMLKVGASGYITKGDTRAAYLEAIWTVHNGGVYLSEEIDASVYDEVYSDMKQARRIA